MEVTFQNLFDRHSDVFAIHLFKKLIVFHQYELAEKTADFQHVYTINV